MRPGNQNLFIMACLTGLLLLTASTEVMALYRPQGGYAQYRGRAYTQFAVGPAITFYTLHRELQEEVPGIENKKKWWRFLGGSRNYDLSIAYTFDNGFILGGDLSLVRSRGVDGLQEMSKVGAPENPGEIYSIMLGPVVGFFVRPYLGWYIQFQPTLGYTTFSSDAPTVGLRTITGYEWPAGPAGAVGLSIAIEGQLTTSEDEGERASIKYDSVHIPLTAILGFCFKGFWNRKAPPPPSVVVQGKGGKKK